MTCYIAIWAEDNECRLVNVDDIMRDHTWECLKNESQARTASIYRHVMNEAFALSVRVSHIIVFEAEVSIVELTAMVANDKSKMFDEMRSNGIILMESSK